MNQIPGTSGSLMVIFATVSSRGQRGEGALWGLFYKSTNLIREDSTLMTENLPKAPCVGMITLGIRMSNGNFEVT